MMYQREGMQEAVRILAGKHKHTCGLQALKPSFPLLFLDKPKTNCRFVTEPFLTPHAYAC
jgi:hypothetical protein